jgi:hypothetical protein
MIKNESGWFGVSLRSELLKKTEVITFLKISPEFFRSPLVWFVVPPPPPP